MVSVLFAGFVCRMVTVSIFFLLQVPFLSVGGDIGMRTIQHRDNSTLSGEYVIEDVKGDSANYRRLIFLSNRNVVQSEARLASRVPHKGEVKGVTGILFYNSFYFLPFW